MKTREEFLAEVGQQMSAVIGKKLEHDSVMLISWLSSGRCECGRQYRRKAWLGRHMLKTGHNVMEFEVESNVPAVPT